LVICLAFPSFVIFSGGSTLRRLNLPANLQRPFPAAAVVLATHPVRQRASPRRAIVEPHA
jgi:hypothetical protein